MDVGRCRRTAIVLLGRSPLGVRRPDQEAEDNDPDDPRNEEGDPGDERDPADQEMAAEKRSARHKEVAEDPDQENDSERDVHERIVRLAGRGCARSARSGRASGRRVEIADVPDVRRVPGELFRDPPDDVDQRQVRVQPPG